MIDPTLRERAEELAASLTTNGDETKAAVLLSVAVAAISRQHLDQLAIDVALLESEKAELLAAPTPPDGEVSRIDAVLPHLRPGLVNLAPSINNDRLVTVAALAAGAATMDAFEDALEATWEHGALADSLAPVIEMVSATRRAAFFAEVVDREPVTGLEAAVLDAGKIVRAHDGPSFGRS